MIVRDYMSGKPITVSPETDVKSAFESLKKYKIRQFPVVSDGKLVGIVTDRDLRVALTRPESKVEDIMASDPLTTGDDMPLEKVALLLRENKVNALPVVSKKNEVIGIITISDVLDALIHFLRLKDKPTKLIVEIPERSNIKIYEVMMMVQEVGPKVLSVNSDKRNKKLCYIWLEKCNISKITKIKNRLKKKGIRVL
ncbi:MAG TPA: CBS domain-containing protein [Thermodesulfobacteriota bacterium]